MTKRAIRERLEQIMVRDLGVSDSFDGDIASSLDSMQRLSFVVAIEDQFRIILDKEDETSLIDLEHVVQLIWRKVNGRNAASST